MDRLPGWEQRLQAIFDRENGAPFQWGRADCATFAADCVEAVTGRDALGPLRGSYASRIASRARMRARGWRTMAEAAGGVLEGMGARPVPPRFASAGSIGVTADGALCVRFPVGFVARFADGRFGLAANVEKAWDL